jgi:predicted DsbA family dithiol-disulfide isomerase
MSRTLLVEVWSDIACPWCYVGKRRWEAALAQFPHAADVQLTWRAYELDPSAPPVRDRAQSYAARLAAKYGKSVAEAQTMIDRMVETAAKDGLALDFVNIQGGNTFLGHRLLHLARERGLQDRVMERMFRGYFCEGAAIGNPDSALRLAVEAGLDVDEVSAVVHSDQFSAEVRADQQRAREIGIDGVPFFVLGGRYAVAGAQPTELFLRALQQSWDEQPELVVCEGEVCGPDGCG